MYWNKLLDSGVYVNLAIPPGTPNSTSLLRCSASAAHTPEQIDRIADAFAKVAQDMHAFEAQQMEPYLLRRSAE